MITFIIPSIARQTLAKTIISILNQSDGDWKCIIVFDGCTITPRVKMLVNNDLRFSYFTIEKTGVKNNAGNVRNVAMRKVSTEWIGFVDDDDTLSPEYVKILKNEVELHDPDTVIFRMKNNTYESVLPIPGINTFPPICGVGISFCMKKTVFDSGCIFIPSDYEDYHLLKKIKDSGYKIILSDHIGYFIR